MGNGVAGEAIGTAEREGVRLKTLLGHAGVKTQAFDVVFHAADEYSDSLPIEWAMMDDALIAYQMNGVPCPLGHGFPARIMAPRVLWNETCPMAHGYRTHHLKITKGIINKKAGRMTPSSKPCRGSLTC